MKQTRAALSDRKFQERVGWAIAQGTIGCGLTLLFVTFAMGAVLGLWSFWTEAIVPLIDKFGVGMLIVPPVLLGLGYFGWFAAGKIIDSWNMR
jgi:hypothetical protein